MTGKAIIVREANIGISDKTAKDFARLGAHTLLTYRCMEKVNDNVYKSTVPSN